MSSPRFIEEVINPFAKRDSLLPDFGMGLIENTSRFHVETPPPIMVSEEPTTSRNTVIRSPHGGNFLMIDEEVKVINSQRTNAEENISEIESAIPKREIEDPLRKVNMSPSR